MLLKWAIALLTKTSHSIYEEIAQLMQLPSLSYVLRKTKGMVGTQNALKDNEVNLCIVKIMSDNLIGSNILVQYNLLLLWELVCKMYVYILNMYNTVQYTCYVYVVCCMKQFISYTCIYIQAIGTVQYIYYSYIV